ncbi:MAG: shikimate dehydrogenase [Endomicrobium sp.]|jgi:shikimate dehydrogenase|nr:shikimate dehydrogenase [Endomicrobium sp.]
MIIKTKLFAILGCPINHSFSPKMYNQWFKKEKLNCIYLAFEPNIKHFKQVLLSLNFLGFSGFNITIPYKIEVIKYLDVIDNTVKKIGSVNTVCIKNNKLYGYNTDWKGFVDDLNDKNIILKNKNILVFGAGGAARAILYALKGLKANKICIVNRTYKNAVNLAKKFNVGSVNLQETKDVFVSVDLLINCSSCGMNTKDVFPFKIDKFKRSLIIYDLIYNKSTPFVKFARSNGVKIFTGEGMLVCQGACSFKIWTGIYPNVKITKKIFENSSIR